MESKILFQQLLNLPEGWKVSEVNFVQPRGSRPQVHIRIAYDTDQGVDVATGELCPVHDYRTERCWGHLDTMGYQTYIYCRVPRIKNSDGKIVSLPLPWAADNERHTHAFENYAVIVLKATHNQTQAGNILNCSYEKVNRVMHRAVERGMERRKLEEDEVIRIGIDEKSYKKGHNYATVISDSEKKESLK